MGTESISARLPSEDTAELRRLAKEDDRTFSYMLAKAVKLFLNQHTSPEPPSPRLAPVPTLPPYQPHTSGFTATNAGVLPHLPQTVVIHSASPAAPADLFPEDEEKPTVLVNVENPMLAEDEELTDLKTRLAASRSGKEIDELSREINRIEGARTMALLNAAPGADPTYVAAREAEEQQRSI